LILRKNNATKGYAKMDDIMWYMATSAWAGNRLQEIDRLAAAAAAATAQWYYVLPQQVESPQGVDM
jgi:hypothetical protein